MNNSNNPQLLTWDTLYNYSTEDSTLFLCLGEFIDNSIQSFEDNLRNKTITGDLEIKIQVRKSPNDDKFEYWIFDNAGGINDLDDAMSLYKNSKDKLQTSKNQYGIGMKFAIFWIGKNGKIYTKKPGESEKYAFFDKLENDVVSNNISISNENFLFNNFKCDHGTCIIIQDVYPDINRNLYLDGKLNNNEDFFGYRYYNYLNKKSDKEFKTSIKIEFYEKDNPNIPKRIIDVTDKNYFNDDDLLSFEKLFDGDENISELLDKHSRAFEDRINPDNREILKPYTDAFFSNKTLSINDKLVLTLNNENHDRIEIPIRVGILKSPDQKRCGMSIKHSGRYIHHPVPKSQDKSAISNYPWIQNNDRGYEKWMIAEMDLIDIPWNEDCLYIMPDKNKAKIIFNKDLDNPIINQDNFNRALDDFVSERYKFLEYIKDLNQIKSTSKNQNKSIDENKKKGAAAGVLKHNGEYFEIPIDILKKGPLENLAYDDVKFKVINDPNDDKLFKIDNVEGNIIYIFNDAYKNLSPQDLKYNYYLLIVILDLIRLSYPNKLPAIEEIVKIFEERKN